MKELFITCPHGFEELLKEELRSLKIPKVRISFCGVFAPQTIENVYKINYCSRIATRALWPLASFACFDRNALYKESKRINWTKFLSPEMTFAVDANVHANPNLNNSHFAALVVKDAICDSMKEKIGSRPSVDIQFPNVQINVFIQKDKGTLYLDTSGMPLHKRGWRKEKGEAVLQETIAASLLLFCGYQSKEEILCDPFCGSGTFLIEAAMIASKTPAGFFRKEWGFFHLPEFNSEDWLSFKESVDHLKEPLMKNKIFGADQSREVIGYCKKNLVEAGFSDAIEVEVCSIDSYSPKQQPSLLITNPPYGKRLQTSKKTYYDLGVFFQNKCTAACRAFALSSENYLIEATRQKILGSFSFKNGGLPVKLYHLAKS